MIDANDRFIGAGGVFDTFFVGSGGTSVEDLVLLSAAGVDVVGIPCECVNGFTTTVLLLSGTLPPSFVVCSATKESPLERLFLFILIILFQFASGVIYFMKFLHHGHRFRFIKISLQIFSPVIGRKKRRCTWSDFHLQPWYLQMNFPISFQWGFGDKL